jgi:hypothetical protein
MQTPRQIQNQPPGNKKRKFILYFSIVVTTIALVVGIKVALAGGDFSQYPDAPPTAGQLSLEQRLKMSDEELGATCQVPDATDLALVASAENENSTYQIWRMKIDGAEIERTTSLFGTACGLVNDSRYMAAPYENVPEDIARELAVASLRYNIELLGGIEKYQASLLGSLEESQQEVDIISRFSSLDVEAWKVVGIEVPTDMYEVIEFVESEPYEN